MTSTEAPSEAAAVSGGTDPARRFPFLAVVGTNVAEAATLAAALTSGGAPVVSARRSACPSCLRALLAALRRPDATLVVATDSPAAVRDADHIVVTDGGLVVESGTAGDLLATPGLFARLYGDELGANVSDPGRDVADE